MSGASTRVIFLVSVLLGLYRIYVYIIVIVIIAWFKSDSGRLLTELTFKYTVLRSYAKLLDILGS